MNIQQLEQSLWKIALLFEGTGSLDKKIEGFCNSQLVFDFLTEVSSLPLHNHALEKSCVEAGELGLVAVIRRLRGCYSRSIFSLLCLLSEAARV